MCIKLNSLQKFLPFVGLDDFAFRKGSTYGTLICDFQTNYPVAILPSRSPEIITTWLKKYPDIQIVSRDGYNGYRQGITKANPYIKQVYDRWHFIVNAKKQLDNLLLSIVPATITWNIPSTIQEEIPLTRKEQRRHERQKEKWQLIQQIQQAHCNGKNISRLAKEYELDRKTIQKYTKMKDLPSFKRVRKKSIDPYYHCILELEKHGNTIKQIYYAIQEQGYNGPFSSVRTMVAKIRKEKKYCLSNENVISISRKKLGHLIWKYSDELMEEDVDLLKRCAKEYQAIIPLYKIIQIFRASIRKRDINAFLKWLQNQLNNRKNPFYHYAFRLQSDLDAVKNAFLLPYSNGLLEGHVNRLKAIKRLTYGRAGVRLLEKRVLYKF